MAGELHCRWIRNDWFGETTSAFIFACSVFVFRDMCCSSLTVNNRAFREWPDNRCLQAYSTIFSSLKRPARAWWWDNHSIRICNFSGTTFYMHPPMDVTLPSKLFFPVLYWEPEAPTVSVITLQYVSSSWRLFNFDVPGGLSSLCHIGTNFLLWVFFSNEFVLFNSLSTALFSQPYFYFVDYFDIQYRNTHINFWLIRFLGKQLWKFICCVIFIHRPVPYFAAELSDN